MILGLGMFFFPDTPRWLMMKERYDDALRSLSKLRRKDRDCPELVNEYLEIKASILLENTFSREHFPNKSGLRLHAAQVSILNHSSFVFGAVSLNMAVPLISDHMGPVQAAGNRMLHHVLSAVHGLQW
jgi:hypothetical protein